MILPEMRNDLERKGSFNRSGMGRRDILKTGALAAALGKSDAAFAAVGRQESVRDRLWLWGHYEGSHNTHYNLPAKSRIEKACSVETTMILPAP